MLSAIITRVSGNTTLEFANTYLFDPLGITMDYWPQDPQGIYRGGHDTFLSPRDLARFGLLYLNKGKLDGKQIVPEEWVNVSTVDQTGHTPENPEYGYLWWIKHDETYTSYLAGGLGGQSVMVIPEIDTIVVATAEVINFIPLPDQGGKMADIVHNVILNIDPDVFPSNGATRKVSIETSFITAFVAFLYLNKRKKGRNRKSD